MEELEELGEGGQVKTHTQETDGHSSTHTHTHQLLHTDPVVTPPNPPPTCALSRVGGRETCLPSRGGGEVLQSLCFALTPHVQL